MGILSPHHPDSLTPPLEARIGTLKHKRPRLEAVLTRLATAAGKRLPLPPSSASASDLPHHGSGPVAEPPTWDADQAASSAANALVTFSRKRKPPATAAEVCELEAEATAANTASASASASGCGGPGSFCAERFPTPSTLAIHERAYTSEKPYACSMCPRRFSHKHHVAPHERAHTGEKPYACSMCPRRFSQKSAVAPHVRTHTGEKPHGCSMCLRRFTRKSSVARHERTHTVGEKP